MEKDIEKKVYELETKKEIETLKYEPEKGEYLNDEYSGKFLQYKKYQILPTNILNPFTENKRLLIEYATGTGKTITGLRMAKQFIDIYKEKYYNKYSKTPYVIILGFTKEIIIKELLKYPELGIILEEEKLKLSILKEKSKSGKEDDLKVYNKYLSRIKRKIVDREKGGFYKFFGYRELVNRVLDIDHLSEEKIDIPEYLKNNKVNKLFLEQFKNSLIICDEVHNTYNTLEKNNYGLVIQYILNYFKDNIYGIFLSATPLNNSASEIIDLLNLLNITTEPILKEDYFIKNKIIDKKLKLLGQLTFGKTLFLPALGDQYPTKIMEGKSLKEIKYLKFKCCYMTENHEEAYKDIIDRKINIEESIINDIIIPNPAYDLNKEKNAKYIYNSMVIKSKIRNSDQDWKRKYGLDIINRGNDEVISGTFFNKKNLILYSSKYVEMLNTIEEILTNSKINGKILIYHHWVAIGTFLIREILIQNGFIDENMSSANNTKCAICGIIKEKHKKIKEHKYYPARFSILHNKIEKKKMDEILDEYNSEKNRFGTYKKILIGSQLIKEGFNFNCIQHLLILSLPTNITTLVQIMGRAVRLLSHELLPPDNNFVHIYIFLNMNKNFKTHEFQRYIKKMDEYEEIQKILKEIHRYSLNNITDYEYIKKIIKGDSIELLEYKPAFKLNNFSDNNLLNNPFFDLTFNINEHYKEEINEMSMLIKRLFIKNTVYTYEQLWNDLTKKSTFPTTYKTSLYSEDNFKIVLYNLTVDDVVLQQPINTLNSILDPDIKNILIDGLTYKITQIDKYYILVQSNNGIPIIDINSFYRTKENQKHKEILIPNNFNKIKKFDILLDYLLNEYDLTFKFIMDFDEEFHYFIIEKLIQNNDKKLIPIKNILINFYESLKILIFNNNSKLIGYTTKTVDKIYKNNQWIEEEKNTINSIENDIIVGYFQDNKLILRDSLKTLQKEKIEDMRKIKKGLACKSYDKEALIKLHKKLSKLETKWTLSSNDIGKLRKVKICDDILLKLIELEIKQRKLVKPKIRYLYIFNDELPSF